MQQKPRIFGLSVKCVPVSARDFEGFCADQWCEQSAMRQHAPTQCCTLCHPLLAPSKDPLQRTLVQFHAGILELFKKLDSDMPFAADV